MLPPNAYRHKNGNVFLKPYIGRENGKRIYGKTVKLGDADTPTSQIWAKFESLSQGKRMVKDVLEYYLESKHVQGLSVPTRKEYERAKDSLPFSCPADELSPKAIRRYLDDHPSPISASRQIAFLRAAYNYGKQRLDGLDSNPADGITLNKAQPRTRLLSKDEIKAFCSVCNPAYSCFTRLTAAVAGRLSEVIALKWEDYEESWDGKTKTLLVRRLKGSRDTLFTVDGDLQTIIWECRNLGPSDYILHSNGNPLTRNGVQSYWQRAMKRYTGEHFAIHHLRHYGVSYGASGGHRTLRQQDAYSHLPIKTVSAEL